MLRGFAGLTVIDGSSSWPLTMVASNEVPGQPPGNGLGPDTRRRSTVYGCAAATAGTAALTARIANTARACRLVADRTVVISISGLAREAPSRPPLRGGWARPPAWGVLRW